MQQNISHFQTKRGELDNRLCTKSDPPLLKHNHCMIAQAGRQTGKAILAIIYTRDPTTSNTGA